LERSWSVGGKPEKITRSHDELCLRDQQNGNAFIDQEKSDSLKTDILKKVVKAKSSCYIAA